MITSVTKFCETNNEWDKCVSYNFGIFFNEVLI